MIDAGDAGGSGVKTRQLLQATLPPNVTNPDPVAAGELSASCPLTTVLPSTLQPKTSLL